MLRWLLPLLLTIGCDCGDDGPPAASCTSSADCAADEICIDMRCQPRGGVDGGGIDGPSCPTPCGTSCCTAAEVCVADSCVVAGASCTDNDGCSDDSYCDPASMTCVPWGTPPGMDTDPSCSRVILAGTFAPTLQCEFRDAPAGDPFPGHVHVLGTPMVADFAIGRAPTDPARPSIVAVFDDGVDGSSEEPTGVIRILDGATCAQQAQLGTLQLVSHSSPPAIGDLDGDGRAEIVANKAGGGVVAFGYDDAMGAWQVLWVSTSGGAPYNVTGAGWAGPSLYDLDDDGVPEVLRGGIVLDASGALQDASLGVFPYSAGAFGVVADVDGDGAAEQVQGEGVWEWNGAAWVAEAYSPTTTPAGHVGLADFGDFRGGQDWPETTPEVAVVTNGMGRVQTLDGTIVFGPVAIPGGGAGGPPTIADFDGDGRPEFASAGLANYAVFDLDCGPTPVGECASGRTDGLLWFQPSQDASSNRTGSSVFDFEGDGRAEAVYGDECFVRVYDGQTGDVVFSQFRSSCTWYENPVIADLDGDFNAEIVIGNNFNCGSASAGVACTALEPGAIDPLFAGLRCGDGTDCLSGTCDAGFCRCTEATECCSGLGCAESGFVCAAPPAGTPGTGNTCRASHPNGARGIRVYRDTADRWVGSRRIWNQHAYHVTNVDEDGTIPSTSAMMDNWTTMGLNNFRQNVQGEGNPDDAPDVTNRAIRVACSGADYTLGTNVCNRGTSPVGSGITVGFYDGDPDAGGTLLCTATTAGNLMPGSCEEVECMGTGMIEGLTITAVADDAGAEGECHEGNNRATLEAATCLM